MAKLSVLGGRIVEETDELRVKNRLERGAELKVRESYNGVWVSGPSFP